MGEHVQRRLAAILAADVVGYSRLMEANEERTMVALKQQRREFFDQGEKTVKNIVQPVHVYFVNLAHTPATGAPQAATSGQAPLRSDKPSVAVLPFSNMSNDPEQDFFSDGITEDIITDLSNVS